MQNTAILGKEQVGRDAGMVRVERGWEGQENAAFQY
jgi:hypothetical protein